MIKTTIILLVLSDLVLFGQKKFEQDTIPTSDGNLVITFIGHGSLLFEFDGKTIYLDPVINETEYNSMPDGDLILITHTHSDHLHLKSIEALTKKETEIIVTEKGLSMLKKSESTNVLTNGSETVAKGFKINAIPAYNLVNKRPDGSPFHTKGEGNGYIIQFGNIKVFIAGDTENIPEIKSLEGIDIAFLPMNLPYTMTPAMVADAVKEFKPKILYPYHFGETNTSELLKLLENVKEVEVRIRKMK